jgi:hypothetical protein
MLPSALFSAPAFWGALAPEVATRIQSGLWGEALAPAATTLATVTPLSVAVAIAVIVSVSPTAPVDKVKEPMEMVAGFINWSNLTLNKVGLMYSTKDTRGAAAKTTGAQGKPLDQIIVETRTRNEMAFFM